MNGESSGGWEVVRRAMNGLRNNASMQKWVIWICTGLFLLILGSFSYTTYSTRDGLTKADHKASEKRLDSHDELFQDINKRMTKLAVGQATIGTNVNAILSLLEGKRVTGVIGESQP